MMISSATAWLTKESADASRWFSRSITKENSTRPNTAIAVNSATAIAACSPADHGIEERDQVDDEADLREQHQRERRRYRQEADIAKRRARICVGDGASAAVDGASAGMNRRTPDEQQDHRNHHHDHHHGRRDHRRRKSPNGRSRPPAAARR